MILDTEESGFESDPNLGTATTLGKLFASYTCSFLPYEL